MIRLLAYFGSILVVMVVLQQVPVIGAWFRIPLVGFFTSAALVGYLGRRYAERLLDRHKLASEMRRLGGVETPHNQGKLGAALEARGRYRAAVPYFRDAARGEPETAEWSWRLGHCLLRSGDAAGAIESLERAVALDERIGYGAGLIQLAVATQRSGDGEKALEYMERAERNHGPNPESSYRRAMILLGLGRKPEARAALQEVRVLAKQDARYRAAENRGWVLRASLRLLIT